jgi:Ni/Co efflux regulator RcnB
VKTIKNLCLAILALSLLATPALAQRGRSNRGGATRGIPRSDQVQAKNKKTDKDTDPTKGSKAKKTRTRKGWDKNAEHNANGHSK